MSTLFPVQRLRKRIVCWRIVRCYLLTADYWVILKVHQIVAYTTIMVKCSLDVLLLLAVFNRNLSIKLVPGN